jgi:hypothetical protein
VTFTGALKPVVAISTLKKYAFFSETVKTALQAKALGARELSVFEILAESLVPL